MKLSIKARRFVLVAVILSFIVVGVLSFPEGHAQELPCNGGDPDIECPLDTNVLVLVALSAFVGVFYIRRAKESDSVN